MNLVQDCIVCARVIRKLLPRFFVFMSSTQMCSSPQDIQYHASKTSTNRQLRTNGIYYRHKSDWAFANKDCRMDPPSIMGATWWRWNKTREYRLFVSITWRNIYWRKALHWTSLIVGLKCVNMSASKVILIWMNVSCNAYNSCASLYASSTESKFLRSW